MRHVAVICAICCAGCLFAQEVLVFEAEDYSSPRTAWGNDITPKDRWNLWSKDVDAEKKWSGGKVLQSPPVLEDRKRPEDGAPPLRTVLTGIPKGKWRVYIKFGRELAVSLDGKTWRRLSETRGVLGRFDITDGKLEFWVDDMFVHKPSPGFAYYDCIILTPVLPQENGVVNGDFEFTKTVAVSGWSWWSREGKGSASLVEPGKSGKRCAFIQHEGERDWAFYNSGRLKVKPGQVWRLSAWMKCQQTDGIDVALVGMADGRVVRWSIAENGIFGTRDWTKVEATAVIPDWCDEVYVRVVGSGKTRAWVDAVTLRPGELPKRPAIRKPKVKGWARERVEEKMGRGLVALVTADGKVYVGWRLLKSDPPNVAFNVYRARGRGMGVRLNEKPIATTTDFVDSDPPRGFDLRYWVRPVVGGRELEPSEQVHLPARPQPKPYISIKLKGDYTFQKVGIADLNGDGRYDFVIKQPNSNIDPHRTYWKPSPGTYKIEAYLHDGRFLWRRDLGWAIEQGIWYSPYVVYDLDGDGKAEVALKTGEGDPRDPDGRVRSGPEYLSIWDGMTGEEKARVDWPSRDGFTGGHAYNYASRNQIGIAYLDGKTPCLLVARGTYTLMKLVAYQYHDGKLERLWSWDSSEEVGRGNYYGQGAHFMHAADVDGDGRDEVILGSCVIDDNGRGLWSTGMGHPDHCYVGDIDPFRPGLEAYYGMETPQLRNGVCLVDAKTGKVIWGIDERTYHVHASGLCSDIDALHPGMECYSGEHPRSPAKHRRWLHAASGKLIADEKSFDVGLSPRAVYWDADPQRELLLGSRILDFRGALHTDAIQGSQAAWADILGDWREEIITSVPGELRIYTTTIPAADRRVCLMQDPIYRLDVAHLAMGYPQPPMTSYCLASDAATLGLQLDTPRLVAGKPVQGKVILAAPLKRGLAGVVDLAVQGPATVQPTRLSIKAAAGRTAEAQFTVSLHAPVPITTPLQLVRITARLRGADSRLQAEATARAEPILPDGAVVVQAEHFSAQHGGQVRIRQDKVGAEGKSISHWDNEGHWLMWKVQVPRAGRYILVLRYCSPRSVARVVSLGEVTIKQTFPDTGGFSSGRDDWAFALVRDRSGQPLAFELRPGEHDIKLTNIDGQGMNLDYLALIPAGP